MKKLSLIIFLILGFGLIVFGQTKCERLSDAALGVSFCAPGGWAIKELPEVGSVIFGERTGQFTRNINMRGAAFKGTVSDAADAGTKLILATKPGEVAKVELVSRKPFAAGKSQGFKVVFKTQFQGVTAKTIQYYFAGKGENKIAITATLIWSDPPATETAIDAAIKTFEMTK